MRQLSSESHIRRRLRSTLLLICATCVFLAGSRSTTWAQRASSSTREERLSDPVYMAWINSDRIGQCVLCHIQGPSDAELDRGNLSQYSRREEMIHWLEKDKHAIARRRVEPLTEAARNEQARSMLAWLSRVQRDAVTRYAELGRPIDPQKLTFDREAFRQWFGTSNQLSRRICDKLYGDGAVETREGYERFRNDCLTCHGGYQTGSTGFDFEQGPEKHQLGIDCLYCHQANDEDAWVLAHQDGAAWRLRAPDDKASMGMHDLTNEVKQTTLCFDCHIGNRDKGMFVTHEMYAAGHPPLPSVEAETFGQRMPQHWQSPGQLYRGLAGEQDRDEYFSVNYPGVVTGTTPEEIYWQTRRMVIGSLQAKHQQLELLVQSADQDRWGDYALYDCAGCHHELRTRSVRRLRLRETTAAHSNRGNTKALGRLSPGRPIPHEWPDALSRPVWSIVERDEDPLKSFADVHALTAELVESFDVRPFGDPRRVRDAAVAMQEALGRDVQALATKPLGEQTAKRLLLQLSQTDEASLVSYDAARQVVWAMIVVASELADHGVMESELLAKVKRLGVGTETGIDVNLPAGREQSIFPGALRDDLQRRRAYRAESFAERLKEVSDELKSAFDGISS